MTQLELPLDETQEKHFLGWVVVDATGKPMPFARDQPPRLYYYFEKAVRAAAGKGGRAVPVWVRPDP